MIVEPVKIVNREYECEDEKTLQRGRGRLHQEHRHNTSDYLSTIIDASLNLIFLGEMPERKREKGKSWKRTIDYYYYYYYYHYYHHHTCCFICC